MAKRPVKTDRHTKKALGLRISDEASTLLDQLAAKRHTTKAQVIEDALAALAGRNDAPSIETLIQGITSRLNGLAETERQLDAALDQIERLTAKD
jgi:predicted transcriptional regulator